MLSLFGNRMPLCDRVSRRSFLRIGGLALGGVGLPQMLQAEQAAGVNGQGKGVIMVFLPGGPPHQDMWDLKVDAPKEIRGEFQPIRDGWVSTGELQGAFNGNTLYEHALVLTSAMGPVIVTGCAHPGICSILEKVRHWSRSPIYLVLGGFHLLDADDAEILKIIDRMKDLGVANVAPTHCTGERATELLRDGFGPHFVAIRNGSHVEIPE